MLNERATRVNRRIDLVSHYRPLSMKKKTTFDLWEPRLKNFDWKMMFIGLLCIESNSKLWFHRLQVPLFFFFFTQQFQSRINADLGRLNKKTRFWLILNMLHSDDANGQDSGKKTTGNIIYTSEDIFLLFGRISQKNCGFGWAKKMECLVVLFDVLNYITLLWEFFFCWHRVA